MVCSTKPKDDFFINDPENGAEDSNVALEKLRDVIAQCILPQAGKQNGKAHTECRNVVVCMFILAVMFEGENEDEKLNEVMYEAWRFNRDCKLLRDGLQGLSWNGKCLRLFKGIFRFSAE